jgi:hypothetical protein
LEEEEEKVEVLMIMVIQEMTVALIILIKCGMNK